MRIFVNTYGLLVAALMLVGLCGCSSTTDSVASTSLEYARYFDIAADHNGNQVVITIDPSSGARDSLVVNKPFQRIICMSSSFVAALSMVGKDSTVVGVSALDYLSNQTVKSIAKEVGYEASPDYETIISLQPDLVVAYSTSGMEPQYVTRLKELGMRVLMVSDFLEEHPLARAEYVRLFGALTGTLPLADSLFASVSENYESARQSASNLSKVKVLMNIPYSDQWFIPGADNYMSRLVSDAGGTILGSKEGQSESSIISLEKAFMLSTEADIWLNPGWCASIADLKSVNPLFKDFPVIQKSVYNNTLRNNSEGGNDFWETGAMRPDLILSDLISVLHPEVTWTEGNLHFYLELR